MPAFKLLHFFYLFSLLLVLLCVFPTDAQIYVLGMHHSGTSVVTKMISLMGANVGEDHQLLVSERTSKEFYERSDVVNLNQHLLEVGGRVSRPSWVGYKFKQETLESNATFLHENFNPKAKAILTELDKEGKTWSLKDPRQSLTVKYWLKAHDKLAEEGKIASKPVTCVVVHRDLLPMLKTLGKWSPLVDGLSYEQWIQSWNAYMLSIGSACANRNIILVKNVDSWSQEEYFENFLNLFQQLAVSYPDLKLPTKEAISELSEALDSPRKRDEVDIYKYEILEPVIGKLTTSIIRSLENGEIVIPKPHFSLSNVWQINPPTADILPEKYIVNSPTSVNLKTVKPKHAEAYVTLITSENPLYMGLALTLAHSIRKIDEHRDIVAMMSENIPTHWDAILKTVGYTVIRVPNIPEQWLGKVKSCFTSEAIIKRWGSLMAKLNAWTLTQYEKIVFLDTDIILISNADHLFKLSGFGGGRGHFGRAGLFNAGFMVADPSLRVFNELIAFKEANESPVRMFNNLLDCTEMGLLNTYFNKEVTLLPMASPYAIQYSPVMHWYGDHKPWEPLDIQCYPTPYLANKLWVSIWTETEAALYPIFKGDLHFESLRAALNGIISSSPRLHSTRAKKVSRSEDGYYYDLNDKYDQYDNIDYDNVDSQYGNYGSREEEGYYYELLSSDLRRRNVNEEVNTNSLFFDFEFEGISRPGAKSDDDGYYYEELLGLQSVKQVESEVRSNESQHDGHDDSNEL